MNIEQICELNSKIEVDKFYQICYVIKDETFDVDFFENNDEKEILEHWMNKIGAMISIESVLKEDIIEIPEKWKKSIEKDMDKGLPISKLYNEGHQSLFKEIKKMSIFPKYNVQNSSEYTFKIIVVFNAENLFSFVIENPREDEYNIAKNERYGFLLKFDENIENCIHILPIINKLFHEKYFNNANEFYNHMNTIKTIMKKEDDNSFSKNVKDFINFKYDITNNIEDKKKSFLLFKQIEMYFKIIKKPIGAEKTFKNQISKILLEIGLKKVRLDDGFYFYGLKNKYNLSIESIVKF